MNGRKIYIIDDHYKLTYYPKDADCVTDGKNWMVSENKDGLDYCLGFYATQREAIESVNPHGIPLTPGRFKKYRKKLGLTQSQLAYILNVNPRTVRKWEKDDGTRPVNPIAIRVMQWMLAGYRPPEFPQD